MGAKFRSMSKITFIEESAGFASADPKFGKPSTESTSRHRIIRSNTETIYRAAKRPKAAPMVSVLDLMILCLDVDSVEGLPNVESAEANPADSSINVI